MPFEPVILNEPFTSLDTMQTTEGKAPAFWEAGYNVCLAAAATELRKDGRALLHLARAYELAPRLGSGPNLSVGSPCGASSIVQLAGEVRNSLDWRPCTSQKREASNRSLGTN